MASEAPRRTSTRHFFGLIPGLGLWWYRSRLKDYQRLALPHRTYCVGYKLVEALSRRPGFKEARVSCIPNGIDVAHYRPDATLREKTRKAWGIPQEAFVFGAVGRLSPEKRYDVAISVYARLLREGGCSPPQWFVLVGSGSERDRLKRHAQALGVEASCVFVDFLEDPSPAYQVLDCFLMPSANEGLPLALLEALACGCRAVAFAVGDIPSLAPKAPLLTVAESATEDAFLAAVRSSRNLDGSCYQKAAVETRKYIETCHDVNKQTGKFARAIVDSF